MTCWKKMKEEYYFYTDSKESVCNVGDLGSVPGSGRSPGEGNGNPLQYSCLENPMDRGAWWATVHGVTKSWSGLSEWHSLFHLRLWDTSEKEGLSSLLTGWDWRRGSLSHSCGPGLDLYLHSPLLYNLKWASNVSWLLWSKDLGSWAVVAALPVEMWVIG